MRRLWVIALLAAAAAADEERALPTRASATLNRDGATYYVEGRQRIAWGTEITVQKRIRIVGRGSGAVLEVAGKFQVIGITDGECEISNLRIEPAARFQVVRLDMTRFRDGGGIGTPKERPAAGTLVVENCELHQGVKLDVTLRGGKVRLLNTMFYDPVRLTAVPEEGKTRATLEVDIISNFLKPRRRGALDQGTSYSGFVEGLFLTGASKAIFRNNRLRGQAEFVDCPKLTFDGNRVDVDRLVIRHSVNGGFQRTKIQKSDFSGRTLVLQSPAGKAKEKVVIDKCWFRGVTDPRNIQQSFIRDGHDDPDCGVQAVLRKVNRRPLGLAGMPQ
ncbi:MAG: hypothetical protein ACYTEZ_15405 [Planctomycetota bacterium]